jgi:hypothetical protein
MQVRYRYRLYPAPGQQQMLARSFGCARVVYNDCLRLRDAPAAILRKQDGRPSAPERRGTAGRDHLTHLAHAASPERQVPEQATGNQLPYMSRTPGVAERDQQPLLFT